MPLGLISAPSEAESTWLTAREAGEVARVAEKTLANWRSLGIGPPYRKLSAGRGGRVRYSRHALQEWLHAGHREGAA